MNAKNVGLTITAACRLFKMNFKQGWMNNKRKMNLKRILCAGLLGMTVFANASATAKPNVILIVADDLGTGDVSCYGDGKIATPHLDELASEGLRLTEAHSASAVCTPSRFAMLSGRNYWSRWNGELLIREEWNTLPDVFRENGYATGYFGKWHLGWGENYEGRAHRQDIDWNKTLPAGVLECGFDTYFGTPFSHNEAPSLFVKDRTVVGLDPEDPIEIIPPKLSPPWGKSTGGEKAHAARPESRIDLIVTEKAQEWIKNNSTKPFFLNLALVAPHVPISPAEEFRGKSGLGAYGDFVQQMDWCVGQIMKALQECGIEDNTIVMFTSDNGAVMFSETLEQGHRSNSKFLGQKTDAWEGGVRVPFIVRWPAQIKAGVTSDALFNLSDICKTSWDAAGIKPELDTALDSISQLQVWLNPDGEPARTEMLQGGVFGMAFRSGDWVYLPRQGSLGMTTGDNDWFLSVNQMGLPNSDYDEEGKLKDDAPDTQLYNLKKDPSQSSNVVNAFPEKAALLAARYKVVHQALQQRTIELGRAEKQ